MKTILAHYISISNDTTFNIVNRNIIIEKVDSEDKRNDFYIKSMRIIKDFERQCPNVEGIYHMFCPTMEGHSIHSEKLIVNPDCYEGKGLMELHAYNFSDVNFNTFIERYKMMMSKINGKSFLDEFDLWIKESPEAYSYIRSLKD